MHKHLQAGWARYTGIALLTAAAFGGGLHLRQGNASGHDLFRAQTAQGQSTPGHSGLTLTGSSTGTRIAVLPSPRFKAQIATDDNSPSSPATTFQDVYALLRRNYVDGVPDDSKMSHGAVSAMLSSLQDPATRFLEADEFAEVKREMQGRYAGIGAVLDVRTTVTQKTADDPTRDKDHPANISYALTVVEALPGSPAEKSGLKSGDVITDINGQWVATYDLVSAQAKELKAAQDKNDPVALNKLIKMLQAKLDNGITLQQAQTKLRDPKENTLTLTVSRSGEAQPITLKIEPGKEITAPSVTAKAMPDGSAYIQLGVMHSNTAEEFTRQLTALGLGIKGLVLDLRGTSGGSPETAAVIASKIGTATTLGLRLGKGLTTIPISISPAKSLMGPVVVLIDGSTAGPAELLASALKAGGAKLVGSATFGDDRDVRTLSLPDGSGFTLTVGQLLTSTGGQYGKTGITPDILAPEKGSGDAALNRAQMELSGRVAQR